MIQHRPLTSVYRAQQARSAGEIEMMKKDLSDKQKDLKDEYHEIEKRYKLELIRVKVSSVRACGTMRQEADAGGSSDD